MTDHLLHDDDDDKKADAGGKYNEFECPSCNAHNPVDDGFAVGDEVLCHYCGAGFLVKTRGDGRLQFKET